MASSSRITSQPSEQLQEDWDLHICPRHQLPKIPEICPSDGATDAHPPPPPHLHPNPHPPPRDEVPSYETLGGIPGYDVERDAASIPYYTRIHLQKLSQGIHARLVDIDDTLESHHRVKSTAQRVLRGLYFILLVLGIVWAIMSIISLVSFLRNRY